MMNYNLAFAKKYIDGETAVCWLRRDLRLYDQAALFHALKENDAVQLVFIFDENILDELEDKNDKRVQFIYSALLKINHDLQKHGSSLLVLTGDPINIFRQLNPKSVYTNRDYEPYARKRDASIANILQEKGSSLKTYKDQVIFEKNEISKDDGTPYTIFTSYHKKWRAALIPSSLDEYPVKKYLAHLKKSCSPPFPQLEEIGFKKTDETFPYPTIKSSIIRTYHETRDFPAQNGTSRLSVHLRFGTISIRKLASIASEKNEAYLKELIWREFYMMILFHNPHIVTKSFKPAYDHIEWQNNVDEFHAWCNGKTGYPIVDAGMRELNTTGYMHNRTRMITASFLTKHLLIDWRWGEAYFARKLLDFDLAANNGGWQWAAGSGCDAAPYFRVFNPTLQSQKFDPEFKYIRQWVEEYGTNAYPRPIVDHSFARARALNTYGSALATKNSVQV